MHIETYYQGVELHRGDKIIYGHFLEPHHVISTCHAHGGLRDDLDYVLNYQSCEPCNHMRNLNFRNSEDYQRSICEPHGLPPQRCATMGTAANMHHAAFSRQQYNDLEVITIVTAGVKTNAGRVGDPASAVETAEGFKTLDQTDTLPGPGTINTMVFISQALTPAALTRSVMTATEAKTATLQELNVNSRYSDGPATGTGTDQIIISAPKRDGYQLTWAGKHSKLGELIGLTVKGAVREALGKQNNLTARGQCSVKIHLERFGATRDNLLEEIGSHLDKTTAQLLSDNFGGLLRDPLVVAATASMAHLRDKFTWKILPDSCWVDIMTAAAAQLASAVNNRHEEIAEYRRKLASTTRGQSNQEFIQLCCHALALGFESKWKD